MDIENKEISSLILDPNNARKHSERNLKAITASLDKFGQRKPIVIAADGTVLAGNGTILAATQLGWKTVDAVVAPAEWDETMLKAYALADNRTAELAEWDEDVLNRQLEELRLHDFDVDILEFGEDYSSTDLETATGDEVDDVPPPPKDPISKPGDVWILGRHKVFCGSSTEDGAYEKLLGEERIDLVLTDPPYGVAYVGKTKDALTIENDDLDTAMLEGFLRDAFSLTNSYTRPGGCWYVYAPSGPAFQAFCIPLTELGIWRQTLIWVKNSLVMGRSDYHYRHEAIFYGWSPGAAHQAVPDRKQDTIFEYDRPSKSTDHPTMKPIDLLQRSILNSSNQNDIVFDGFGGSGSTLIACETLGRSCRTIEVDPKYVDVICRRYQQLTGITPKLESTGEDTNFILAES
jgi:site-specific DNA-methyltransferase (adenine-specific)